MDQVAAPLSRAGHALLFETGDDRIRYVLLTCRVWILETSVTHRLSDGQFNLRRSECEAALRLVEEHGVHAASLADVPPERLPRLLREIPAPWGPRLRHLVSEVARTRLAAQALSSRDLTRLGELLVEGHHSLRVDYQSTCPEADLIVESAVRHGAYGARLTGAGWDGVVIAVMPEEREQAILAAVAADFEKQYGRQPTTWATRAAGGVRGEK
jgi:galactokinase